MDLPDYLAHQGTDLEALADAARRACGAGPADLLFLGGSLTEGLGSPTSDLDVYFVPASPGQAGRSGSRAFRLGTTLVDVTTLERPFLEALIARRAAFLVDYQDQAYADRYRARLDAFRAALPQDAPEELLRAAARSLFKLMAYKDEFEVARLHRLARFDAELTAQFEGDFQVNYHLAPPLWPARRDARGRPVKRRFGPWMGHVFGLLARMKRLRGSALNPFGYHSEARMHRDLLAWYEGEMDRVAAAYGPQTAAACRAVIAAPDEIRGYGPVRARAAEAARKAAAAALP